MRGYKNFESDPHPGDLRQLVEIGYTENVVNDNGYYPVDRLMHDIALALMAVQTQTTGILDEFPTKAAQAKATEPATTPA